MENLDLYALEIIYFGNAICRLPSMSYMDIVDHAVFTTSFIIEEKMRERKSLIIFFFFDGMVQEVLSASINGQVLLLNKVHPYYSVWGWMLCACVWDTGG